MKKIISLMIVAFACGALFAASMDIKVRTVPKSAMESVFSNPKEGLPVIVRFLTQNVGNESTKVKLLHDWICDNIAYDTEMYFSGWVSKQDYVSVLKKKKGVCSGYASVMNEMCRLAGIESIGIHGWSKGFGYRGELGDRTDHEWNAVKINGKWQLVDVTWDAGHVDYKTWIKHYSDEWLFLEPQYFIYSHLPEKDEYQFLKEKKTKEEFVKEPYVAGKFFKMGFSFGKNIPDYKTIISGEAEFDFGCNQTGISISSTLREAKSGRNVESFSWVNRSRNTFTVNFDVPDRNDYRAFIFAKKLSEENYGNRFSIAQFENDFLPRIAQFVAEKKISKNEADLFESAFFKVEENGSYYIYEDLFATQRNLAVKKIFKLLELSAGYLEPVLDFRIATAESYEGFGNGIKFPSHYAAYSGAVNTKLISPRTGVLKKGSKIKFEITSGDFNGLAVKASDKLVPLTKDSSGVYSAEIEISDVDKVIIYGTKNNKNYTGILFYQVE